MDYFVHVSHPRHINCMNYPGLIRMLNTQKLEQEIEARGTRYLWLPSCVCKATNQSFIAFIFQIFKNHMLWLFFWKRI